MILRGRIYLTASAYAEGFGGQKERKGAARRSRNQRSADSFVRAKVPMRQEHADKAVRAPEKSSQRTMIPRDCSAETQTNKKTKKAGDNFFLDSWLPNLLFRNSMRL
jgi:hypothetical protein